MVVKLNKLLLSCLISCSFIAQAGETSNLKEINDTAQFDEFLSSSQKPVVVEVHGEAWCPPCKAVKKHIKNFANKHKHIHFVKVDVDKNKDISQRYAVGGLPTFLFFEKGSKNPKTEHTVVGGNVARIEDSILKLGSKKRDSKPAKKSVTSDEPKLQSCPKIVQHGPVKKAKPSKSYGKLQQVNSQEEFDNLVAAGPVVVELSKTPCQFCTYMEKPINDLASELKDVAFVVVNESETPELVEKYQSEIRGYPTFLVFKDGQFVKSFGGATQDESANLRILRGRVSSALGKSAMTEVVVNEEDAQAAQETAPAPAKGRKSFAKSKRSRS